MFERSIMSADLKKFFNDYVPLPDVELDDIVSKFKKKKIKKNEFLLMQGEICKDLIFVQNGQAFAPLCSIRFERKTLLVL